MPTPGSGRNLIGDRFGYLVVTGEAPKVSTSRERRWECFCDCGTTTVAFMGNLTRGRTRSCGCSLKNSAISSRLQTHGHNRPNMRTPEYTAWSSMWTRCTNPKDGSFKYYGERGISIAPEWKSFEQFLSDMGKRPSPKHSVERKNVNSGYSALNCYWGTIREQCLNKRNTLRLAFQGDTKTAIEWSEITGIPYRTLCFRIRSGWSPERCLEETVKSPSRTGPTLITLNGETNSLSEWAAITGLKRTTIGMRLQKGWSPENALAPIRRP